MNDSPTIPTPPSRQPARALTVLAVISIVVSTFLYIRGHARTPDTHFDDAYMTIRYVNNFLDGHGLAWNPGTQAFSTTTIFHWQMLSAMRLCLRELSDADLLKLSSFVSGLIAIGLMVVVCARNAHSAALRNRYLTWGGLLCPLLMFNDHFLYHSFSGMDTMVAVMCNTAVVGVALRAARVGTLRSLIPVVICSYLAYLTRPDSGLYAVGFPGLAVWLLGERPGQFKRAMIFGVAIALVLIADMAIKMALWGDPLPLSFYMKSHTLKTGYAGVGDWNPVRYLLQFMSAAIPYLIILVIIADRANARLIAVCMIPVALTFGYFLTTVQVMGFRARFYFPALPLIVIGAGLAIDRYIAARGDRLDFSPNALVLRVLIVLIALIGMPFAHYHLPRAYEARFVEQIPPIDSSRYYTTAAQEPLKTFEWWDSIVQMAHIAKRVPDGTSIAMTELGLVAAEARQIVLIDPTGLHDRYFAHNGFSIDEFLSRKPDLIWMPHGHYVAMLRDILEDDRFWSEYDFYGEMLNFGMAVRKDSPHRDQILSLLRESWEANYAGRDMQEFIARRL